MDYSEKKINFAFVIELERHIEILLLNNDCVIVPGLGGFMTNHVEARYDDEDHMFLPPLRTLGFNPKLRLNDSLLAQSYIEAYDISYPDAVHRIDDEVNELRQHLENEGSYDFNGIGTLSLNDEGCYEFAPCEAGILTPAFYALDSFEMDKLNSSVEVKAETIMPGATSQTRALEPQPAETVSIHQVPTKEESDDDARTIPIKVSVLRNLAAAAIVIFAFLLFSTPLGNSNKQTASIDSRMLKQIMPKEVTTGEKEVKKAITEKRIAIDQQLTKEEKVVDDVYTIVLASHVTKTNANEFVKQLAKKGFDAQVISKTSTKVIYGRYATENEAYQALNQLRGHEDFKEAWVLKVRL